MTEFIIQLLLSIFYGEKFPIPEKIDRIECTGFRHIKINVISTPFYLFHGKQTRTPASPIIPSINPIFDNPYFPFSLIRNT